jgi:hypothetical protein
MLVSLDKKSPLFQHVVHALRGRDSTFFRIPPMNEEQFEAEEENMPPEAKEALEELRAKIPYSEREEGMQIRAISVQPPDTLLFVYDGNRVHEIVAAEGIEALYMVFREVVSVLPALTSDMSKHIEESEWILSHYLRGHKAVYYLGWTNGIPQVDKAVDPVPMSRCVDPMSTYYTAVRN